MNKVFEKYKDTHKGKRAFLIGNGPSLNKTNLNLLEHEISFAMNKISLLYDKYPKWKPTYYLFSSSNVNHPDWGKSWTQSVRESLAVEETTSFVANIFKKTIDPKNDFPNTKWFSSMSEHKPDQNGLIKSKCFSKNVVERIDKSGTTMNLALQLCLHMGFSEIVLLGTDLGYKLDTGSKKDPNHFDKSYRANISNPRKANNQMRNIHSLAYNVFKKRDVKMYNATVETHLDVYPIINFEKYVLNNEVIVSQKRLEQAKKSWDVKPQYV